MRDTNTYRPLRTLLLALSVSSLLSTPASAQATTDIESAIKCGLREVKCEAPVLSPGGLRFAMLDMGVDVIPPLGRVYIAAREAKDKYLTFTRDQVTDEMLAPRIEVRARTTSTKMTENVAVTHLVIVPRGKKAPAVQPTEIADWNYEAKNLAGASLTRVGKRAFFNVGDRPPGELEIVVVTDQSYEMRAGLGQKDREKLNSWSQASSGR